MPFASSSNQSESIPPDEAPIVVHPDPVLRTLLPKFLARRQHDVALLAKELDRGGFRAIETMGHNLKGIGRAYGCDGISEIGAALERAGQGHDATEIRRQATALTQYLQRVRIAP